MLRRWFALLPVIGLLLGTSSQPASGAGVESVARRSGAGAPQVSDIGIVANVMPMVALNSCPPVYSGGIAGTVRAADTLLALNNVFVQVYQNGELVRQAFSGSNGSFAFLNLPDGVYTLSFSPGATHPAYAFEYYDGASALASATPVTVSGTVVTNVDGALDPGARIVGRVTDDETGLGVAGVAVTAFPADPDPFFASPSGTTDASGYYTTTAVPSGQYHVRFIGASPSGPAFAYIPEYYDNRILRAQANVVTVTAPLTLTVNAGMLRGAQISGNVRTGDSNLPVMAIVEITSTDGLLTLSSFAGGGMYVTPGLPAGSYKLLARPVSSWSDYLPAFYDRKANFAAANPVTVTYQQQLGGVNIIVDKGGAIAGQIYGFNPYSAPVSVFIYGSSGELLRQFSLSYGQTSYLVNGLPSGNYRVEFRDPICNRFAPFFYNAKSDYASADVVSVTAPNTTFGINAFVNALRAYLPLVAR